MKTMDAVQWIRFLFFLGVCVSYVKPYPYYDYHPVMHSQKYIKVKPAPAPSKVIHIHHVHQSGKSSHGGSHGYRYKPYISYKPYHTSYTMHHETPHYYHHHQPQQHHQYVIKGSGHHGGHHGRSGRSLVDLLVLSSVMNGGNTRGGGLFGRGTNTNSNTNLLPLVIAGGLD